MRSIRELETQPCRFALKLMPAKTVSIPNPEYNSSIQPSETPGMRKVKKVIQRVDDQGNPLFKTITREVKKGCGCKAKTQTVTKEEIKVPDVIEVWVDEPVPATEPQIVNDVPETITVSEKQALCKMYGTVQFSYCQRCKTYQK